MKISADKLLDTLVEQIAHHQGVYDAAVRLLGTADDPPEGEYVCNCCEEVLEVGEGQICNECQNHLHRVRQEATAKRSKLLDRVSQQYGSALASLWKPGID